VKAGWLGPVYIGLVSPLYPSIFFHQPTSPPP
jgi:hypothetical protein